MAAPVRPGLLLPHGYEGQGPEHSSARLERFLQLYAEDNIQVVLPSTPASYFHALRRQLHREFRKPLIVMTPKSLLRHKRCVSTLDELSPGSSFHRVLWETPPDRGRRAIERVVLCCGKVYYDLLQAREDKWLDGKVALIRLEQLAPFPEEALQRSSSATRRPPDTSGARKSRATWATGSSSAPRIENLMEAPGIEQRRLVYAGRKPSASPATGSHGAARARAAVSWSSDALTHEQRRRYGTARGDAMGVEIKRTDAWRIGDRGHHRQMAQEGRGRGGGRRAAGRARDRQGEPRGPRAGGGHPGGDPGPRRHRRRGGRADRPDRGRWRGGGAERQGGARRSRRWARAAARRPR